MISRSCSLNLSKSDELLQGCSVILNIDCKFLPCSTVLIGLDCDQLAFEEPADQDPYYLLLCSSKLHKKEKGVDDKNIQQDKG